MPRTLVICALVPLTVAAFFLSACQSRSSVEDARVIMRPEDNIAERIDRGDWMVSTGSKVYKVVEQAQPNRPPRHAGYLEERRYRQRRGGPEFTIYSVTTLDRKEQVGHIGPMGRAYRYEPTRNGSFQKIELPSNTLERNVQAILQVGQAVRLENTTERRLAFERLDADGDGVLQAAETRSFGASVAGADRNGDGVVDFEEFDAVDVL